MAYTCPKCGWKHKPSQEKYYKTRGWKQPTCEDCNPSRAHKLKNLQKRFIINSFSTTYIGYGPLASVPYIPLVMLLPISVLYFSQGVMANILSFVVFLVGFLVNANVAVKVGDKLHRKLIRGEPVYLTLLGYYSPFFIFVIAVIIIILNN